MFSILGGPQGIIVLVIVMCVFLLFIITPFSSSEEEPQEEVSEEETKEKEYMKLEIGDAIRLKGTYFRMRYDESITVATYGMVFMVTGFQLGKDNPLENGDPANEGIQIWNPRIGEYIESRWYIEEIAEKVSDVYWNEPSEYTVDLVYGKGRSLYEDAEISKLLS